MIYEVQIRRKVLKILEKINDPDYSNIKAAILALAAEPRPPGCKSLKDAMVTESGKETIELFTKYSIKY